MLFVLIYTQAFGVGAYENDDDDIYATEDLSNYDFTLEDKSQKSKNKSKTNNIHSECIDGFVEDDSKHGLFDELPSAVQIPPGKFFRHLLSNYIIKKIHIILFCELIFLEWRPRGMFERILGQCPPDFYSQCSTSSSTINNVNTRQREMKKPEPPPPSVEQTIKKGDC